MHAASSPPTTTRLHPNSQGVVKEARFKKFKVETMASEAEARQFLHSFGCAHYWDLCANYSPNV